MLMWSVLVASFVMLVLMFVSNLYLSDRRATSSGSSELRKIRHSSWPMRDELMGLMQITLTADARLFLPS